jgi:uncharacterized repeat protein (TIGR02543 family)
VTFDSQGGSTVSPVQVNAGAQVKKPTDPTKTGFDFGGWYKEAACANEWNFNDPVNASMTLYAKWTAVGTKYTVTFNSQGGSAVLSVQVNAEAKVTKPTDPTAPGYIFVGWYKDEDCTKPWDFDVDVVTGNITLYAGWMEAGSDSSGCDSFGLGVGILALAAGVLPRKGKKR